MQLSVRYPNQLFECLLTVECVIYVDGAGLGLRDVAYVIELGKVRAPLATGGVVRQTGDSSCVESLTMYTCIRCDRNVLEVCGVDNELVYPFTQERYPSTIEATGKARIKLTEPTDAKTYQVCYCPGALGLTSCRSTSEFTAAGELVIKVLDEVQHVFCHQGHTKEVPEARLPRLSSRAAPHTTCAVSIVECPGKSSAQACSTAFLRWRPRW